MGYLQRRDPDLQRAVERERQHRLRDDKRRQAAREVAGRRMTNWMRSQLAPSFVTREKVPPDDKVMNDAIRGLFVRASNAGRLDSEAGDRG